MSNLIKQASEEMREIILNTMGRLVGEGKLPAEPVPAFNIEIPADTSHGDFATNAAMLCAKAFKMPPRKIADLICENLILDGSSFERAEAAGPGFINFFLGRRWFSNTVASVLEEGKDYGRTDTGACKKIMVEFVSANPTGPMHIGNARGGAIGDCLASVLSWAGWNVTREFYVNDAGNQIEKFAASLEVRYLQLYKDGVELPEDAYQGADIVEHAKNFAEIHGDKYVNASSKERRDALVAYALPINIAGLERDLLKYRIKYDVWFKESSLHESGKVMEIVKKLGENGLTYEKEGAVWYKSTEFGAEKDDVLVRANGIPTYFAADIAYHYNKFAERGFDKVIDIWGADHHGHVARLKGAMQALGIEPSRLDVVLMQMVRLMRDGELVKVSKRTGKSITLATLLEEVPIDAARFFFNLREANSHFDFDLGLAIEQSSQNPVYYVQYAHARICSIIANLEADGVKLEKLSGKDFDILSAPEEVELIRHLAALPREIDDAAKNYDPSRITKYSIELATKFHKFYAACRVKDENKSLCAARLSLCEAVKIVLENCSEILKIDCPDSM
ncbi:MAG: arginyl-tRNA synthetase [Clostridiales bacterium]|jgi:arginyl-tRNA synthetase|nr:arginyl-tRNA synthetase [Oscillospiraceae bacterium]MDN5377804.1 arginyl-tRNA synthetase [Clostridiales bacterium]